MRPSVDVMELELAGGEDGGGEVVAGVWEMHGGGPGLADGPAVPLVANPSTVVLLPMALQAAAATGHVDALAAMLNADPSLVEARSDAGWTPLHVATRFAKVDAAALLLDRGADVHAADACGCTPLHRASALGHVALVQLLLDRGADPDRLGWGQYYLHARPVDVVATVNQHRDRKAVAAAITHLLRGASAWARRRHAVAAACLDRLTD